MQTPYQVVAVTKQLLNARVLPQAISYIARLMDEEAALTVPSVEVAAPDAHKPVIDNWIIPQPEVARLSRRAFIETGLADMAGPDLPGYGKLAGHGWLLKQFTPEAVAASPLPPSVAACKPVLDQGDIAIACQLDAWNEPHVRTILAERGARLLQEIEA